MASILFVKTSYRGDASVSNRLGASLVARLQEAYPESVVVVRDLAANPPPHLDADYVAGRYLAPDQRTPEQAAAVAPCDQSIAELKAADVIVIASGMINFSISAQLKAWIDQIVRTNATFAFQDQRPVGLVTGKKCYVIEARGGFYDEPPMSHIDFQEPYLRGVLGFIGITDIRFIKAQGMGMGDEMVAKALAGGEAEIAALDIV